MSALRLAGLRAITRRRERVARDGYGMRSAAIAFARIRRSRRHSRHLVAWRVNGVRINTHSFPFIASPFRDKNGAPVLDKFNSLCSADASWSTRIVVFTCRAKTRPFRGQSHAREPYSVSPRACFTAPRACASDRQRIHPPTTSTRSGRHALRRTNSPFVVQRKRSQAHAVSENTDLAFIG